MNRDKTIEAFKDYISDYDCDDPQVKFKIEHTYRVAELSGIIADSIDGIPAKSSNLCWLIGLLHDIGRFEQLRRYGTFSDSQSVDHAELGADILFKEDVIEKFLQQQLTDMSIEQEKSIIELAIRNHNKYRLPEGLNETELFFCNIIRDADKIDIFKVVCETPYELRMSRNEDESSIPAREEVMKAVHNHTSVRKAPNMTSFETTIMGCAMAFDIVFDKSKEVIIQQGYLKQMLSFEPESAVQKQQMKMLREELSYLC